MAGRSRMRPLAATIETTLTVTGSARPDEQVLDHLLAPADRNVRVGERVPQLVVAFDDPGEAEQLVLHLAELVLGPHDLVERLGIRRVRVAGSISSTLRPG